MTSSHQSSAARQDGRVDLLVQREDHHAHRLRRDSSAAALSAACATADVADRRSSICCAISGQPKFSATYRRPRAPIASRSGSSISSLNARPKAAGSPGATRPPPDSRTTSAAPDLGREHDGTPHRHRLEDGVAEILRIGRQREDLGGRHQPVSVRPFDDPRKKRDALPQPTALDERLEARQQALLVVADDREVGRRNRLQRRNQPVEPFLPVDAPKEQDQHAVREERLDVAADRAGAGRVRQSKCRSEW